MCVLRPRRRRRGSDGLAAAARGARGQRVRYGVLAPEVTAASALARMAARNNLRHSYRTIELLKGRGRVAGVNARADEWCLVLVCLTALA